MFLLSDFLQPSNSVAFKNFMICEMLHLFANLIVNKIVFLGGLFKVMVFHEAGSHGSPALAEWWVILGSSGIFLRFSLQGEIRGAQTVLHFPLPF